MKARFAAISRFFLLVLLGLCSQTVAAPRALAGSELASPSLQAVAPAVTLRAASGSAITFLTQNGHTVSNVPPQTLEVPHLVLFRNGTLSDTDERTLILQVNGIDVPPTGVTVTLEVETQHQDPDSGDADIADNPGNRIPVWLETRRIANTSGLTRTNVTAVFVLEFGDTIPSDASTVGTPTDYFRYDVTVTDADHSLTQPTYRFNADYAFLMENQWIAPLPQVSEGITGAAPDELVVYYCDMFPFRKSSHEPATWLPRDKVTEYVGTELVPQMVEAFRVQTDEWGFPWYNEWTSYRSEDTERLSVALTDARTWFHGSAPSGGHSGISIRVQDGNSVAFGTLTDGLVSTFHHELFHNLQRNINLHSGGDGRVDGAENAWQFFSEGTAVLAESVGQPRGQFTQTYPPITYISYANGLVGRSRMPGLDLSYRKVDPYQAAIYWRFLYEQCGGKQGGNPAAGMQVIRRALVTLYSGQVVDIRSSTDLVGALPKVMDQALAGSSCPFQTYQESLTAFARALYELRLDGGRCTEPGTPDGCGLYDPHDQYKEPPISTIAYTGTNQEYRDGISNSFGIDLIDVSLGPTADGRALRSNASLTLEFYGAPASTAEFDVQVLCLADSGESAKLRRVPCELGGAEVLTRASSDGHLVYLVPASRTSVYNRLGLIITRLDARESSDPVGEYTLVLHTGI